MSEPTARAPYLVRREGGLYYLQIRLGTGRALQPRLFTRGLRRGMPCSGTHLVERIITGHPQAFGARVIAAADQMVNGVMIGNGVIVAPISTRRKGRPDAETLCERGQRYVATLSRLGGPDALRVVDVRQANFARLGLLDAAAPGSYFIHCRRHPVDCRSKRGPCIGPCASVSHTTQAPVARVDGRLPDLRIR